MKKFFKIFSKIILILIILAVLLYAALFFAVNRGWTKEEGVVDENNYAFEQSYLQSIGAEEAETSTAADTEISARNLEMARNNCILTAIAHKYPKNVDIIRKTINKTKSADTASRMILAMKLHAADQDIKNASDSCADQATTGVVAGATSAVSDINAPNAFAWVNTEEWPIIVEAIKKDAEVINQAAKDAGVEPRLIVAPLVVEQLRLYFTEREYYKKFFKPLKILVTTNQLSWGVMAIKQNSAIAVENNLKDVNSPYYLGPKFEHALDFATADVVNERYGRLTDEKNHYYAYLYGALYMKEVASQWKKAGFSISDRPEILCTLYNLGFEHSEPKKDPEVGGSEVEIGGDKYSFGGLGYEFYYSGELQNIFPYPAPKI